MFCVFECSYSTSFTPYAWRIRIESAESDTNTQPAAAATGCHQLAAQLSQPVGTLCRPVQCYHQYYEESLVQYLSHRLGCVFNEQFDELTLCPGDYRHQKPVLTLLTAVKGL